MADPAVARHMDYRSSRAPSRRWRWWVILIPAAVGAGVFALALTATPLYHAETRILIGSTAQPSADDTADAFNILLSQPVLDSVISELDLENRVDFIGQPDLLQRALTALGLSERDEYLSRHDAVLQELRRQLDIYRIQDSRVIVVGATAADPTLAADISNRVASRYLDQAGLAAALSERETADLRALQDRVRAAEDALWQFRVTLQDLNARPPVFAAPAGRLLSRAIAPDEPFFPRIFAMSSAAFLGSLFLAGLWFSTRRKTTIGPIEQDELMEIADRERIRTDEWHEPIRKTENTVNYPDAQRPAEDVAPPELILTSPPENDMIVVADKLTEELNAILSVPDAVKAVLKSKTERVLFVSPEGDEAAIISVRFARLLAQKDRRVLLIDLTIAGAATAPMLETLAQPGVTNLLAEDAQFADTIHTDRYSGSHIIPIGSMDAEQAMQAIDRLPTILASLSGAYDVIVLECGRVSPASIDQFLREKFQVMVSALRPAENPVTDVVENLAAAGAEGVMTVTV